MLHSHLFDHGYIECSHHTLYMLNFSHLFDNWCSYIVLTNMHWSIDQLFTHVILLCNWINIHLQGLPLIQDVCNIFTIFWLKTLAHTQDRLGMNNSLYKLGYTIYLSPGISIMVPEHSQVHHICTELMVRFQNKANKSYDTVE